MNHHRDNPTSTAGRLCIYELRHPTDDAKNGDVKRFRDDDQKSADERAARLAKREGCTLVRKSTI